MASTAAATEERTPLNMNELTATVASIIAPYAATQLHAALFSSQHDNSGHWFGLEATFSRYRTQPRGEVTVGGFGKSYARQVDKKAAHARAWLFSTRSDLVNTLTQGFKGSQCAYFLVFWKDNE